MQIVKKVSGAILSIDLCKAFDSLKGHLYSKCLSCMDSVAKLQIGLKFYTKNLNVE